VSLFNKNKRSAPHFVPALVSRKDFKDLEKLATRRISAGGKRQQPDT
jgi:hypothetical protein